MRSFLFKILFFGTGLIALNLIYFLLIFYTDWDFRKRTESLSFDNPKFEVLVLGNSLAMDGVDTEYHGEQGIHGYNLAIGGSSLKTNYIQLNEYLQSYDKPSNVLIGLGSYMNTFERDDIHPYSRVYNGGL
tara:strand:+ start:713 stop:1105 length:393 start_codon:yes stop_codon:yes gene_type:complete